MLSSTQASLLIFSDEFNAAIESKQVAQQEAEKQTAITQAQGKAEAARLNAQALQAQGGSKVLAREWIDKWDGSIPPSHLPVPPLAWEARLCGAWEGPCITLCRVLSLDNSGSR